MSRRDEAPITSLENPQVRFAHSLLEHAGRRRHGSFLVEGLRLVEDASTVARPLLVLHGTAFGRSDARERVLLRRLQAADVPTRAVADRVLGYVADTVTPQAIVAVMPLPGQDARPQRLPAAGGPERAGAGDTPHGDLTLVLDQVGDPGNAGTLLRSAAGAGVSSVIAARGTVDLYAPKVVRAAAGAHFCLFLSTDQSWDAIADQLGEGYQVLLADARAATPYWAVDWTKPSALIVSHETHGASLASQALAAGTIAIPIRHVESLNVAIAGSVILFEALRQRLHASAATTSELP